MKRSNEKMPTFALLVMALVTLTCGGLMAQASAYGLLLVAVIVLPILLATRVFRIDLFASRS